MLQAGRDLFVIKILSEKKIVGFSTGFSPGFHQVSGVSLGIPQIMKQNLHYHTEKQTHPVHGVSMDCLR